MRTLDSEHGFYILNTFYELLTNFLSSLFIIGLIFDLNKDKIARHLG